MKKLMIVCFCLITIKIFSQDRLTEKNFATRSEVIG